MGKIDTLVIIGNGFDIWQELDTSYYHFQQFYLEHRDEILEKLHIKKFRKKNEDGSTTEISDAELLYGDPFESVELEYPFWKTFEASLSMIDSQRLNLFFGKEKSELKRMQKCVKNAIRILTDAFCQWVATFDIDDNETFRAFKKKHNLQDFQFGDNCFFVNFNYTDTLEKRFHIDEDDVFHIHGQCSESDEIIFGHSEHPQMPELALKNLGGRFEGLFHVEQILYETDKHVQNIIQELLFTLVTSGIQAFDIKHIFVLGHSFGEADLEYFDFLVENFNKDRGISYKTFFKNQIYYDRAEWTPERAEQELGKGDSMDELNNRLQYSVKRYGYRVTGQGYQNYGFRSEDQILPEELVAVNRRYGIEQTLQNASLQMQFDELMEAVLGEGALLDPDSLSEGEQSGDLRRNQNVPNAMWHISCFSEADKKWVEQVMKGLGCQNYKLHATIDRCLEEMMK